MSLKHTFLCTKTHLVFLISKHTVFNGLLIPLKDQFHKLQAFTPKKSIVQTGGRKETTVFYMLKEFCQREKDTHTFTHAHTHTQPWQRF